jgi:enediyne biosynthesis protein E4
MTRRAAMALPAIAATSLSQAPSAFVTFADVTRLAGPGLHDFRHNNGAYGAKLLPETMGPGCAFLDYDNDGWLDILLINGKDWPGHAGGRSPMRLLRNNRNATFTDVTRAAGLEAFDMYGMGVTVGDYNNDGFPDLYITAVGQNRLLRNNGRGQFVDVTAASGLGGREAFSTSAIWFDFDRDGHLDLFVCNYVRWSPDQDVRCSLDGKNKSYCTPEAYRGSTCWLFRNRGNGTFEDVTARSGIFDPSGKSLGVAMLDYDHDGWPDLFVANDTQPNKLYRNNRNGTFTESAVAMGVAFSEDGRARAGMGADTGDFLRSGRMGIAVTNFDNEMIGLYEAGANGGAFVDRALVSGVGDASRRRLGFGCMFGDFDLDGHLDLLAVNGHIDDTVRNVVRGTSHEQPPLLFRNHGKGIFRDMAAQAGDSFASPKVARGIATGDFDRDGDLDVLITTNGGPVHLYRCDVSSGNRSLRFHLDGRKSNRDAIGTIVQVFDAAGMQTQMVKSGSSYLSASDKALTFGCGRQDVIDRVAVFWPSGRADEFRKVATGKSYRIIEGQGLQMLDWR